MAHNVRRSAQFYDKEILKFPQLGLIRKSVVIDATLVAQSADPNTRTVVPAGTILRLSATNADRYFPYDGSGDVKGVLVRHVELLARSTGGNEAGAMFFHEAVFATTQIVGFTQYASALVSSLPTCKFE